MPTFFVTKTYGHEQGLSASFRQHRAESHCRFIHGYPLSFKYTFGAEDLDKNGWVIDFGSLKPIKQRLVDTYDHRLLIAKDDPQLDRLLALGNALSEGYGCSKIECPPVADPLIVEAVGCEAFARMEYDFACAWLTSIGLTLRVWVQEVEVREHGGNSAIYSGAI